MNHPITETITSITKKYDIDCDNHIHGGQLNKIAKHYSIPLSHWVDLSTGINPNGYPATDIPASVWNRLPENNDKLLEIAAHYYGCDNELLLAVPGSQAAIQLIPALFSKCSVGLIHPGYYEHAKHWIKQNHAVTQFQHSPDKNKSNLTPLINQINKKIHFLDALVIINPNNPTGVRFSKQQLLQWHNVLIKKNGYLIVDEAFMDSDDSDSLLSFEILPNLIILRSIGKFFGLAGLRLGFVFSNRVILDKISEQQGPWPISGPSRWLACKALADEKWQTQTRTLLHQNALRLKLLLSEYQLAPTGGSDLFQWIQIPDAENIYQHLNQNGIFTRLFSDPDSLRIGLPKNEIEWQKLHHALHNYFL